MYRPDRLFHEWELFPSIGRTSCPTPQTEILHRAGSDDRTVLPRWPPFGAFRAHKRGLERRSPARRPPCGSVGPGDRGGPDGWSDAGCALRRRPVPSGTSDANAHRDPRAQGRSANPGGRCRSLSRGCPGRPGERLEDQGDRPRSPTAGKQDGASWSGSTGIRTTTTAT